MFLESIRAIPSSYNFDASPEFSMSSSIIQITFFVEILKDN
jgi:hypothetical protein